MILPCLQLDISHNADLDAFIGRVAQGGHKLIALASPKEHVEREQRGIEYLSHLNGALGIQPVVSVYSVSPQVRPPEVKEFRRKLVPLIREAERYGWVVNQHLEMQRS